MTNAAGGINGDIARVKQHWHADWSRPPETILNGSHKYADGRLHDAAATLGANITHLDWQWNYAAGVHHWQPRKPSHGLSLVPPSGPDMKVWKAPPGRSSIDGNAGLFGESGKCCVSRQNAECLT